MKLAIYLHLVPRLKIHAAILPHQLCIALIYPLHTVEPVALSLPYLLDKHLEHTEIKFNLKTLFKSQLFF